jgi:hypothetical protein
MSINTARCFYLCNEEFSKKELSDIAIRVKSIKPIIAFRLTQHNNHKLTLDVYSENLYQIKFKDDSDRLEFLHKYECEQLTLSKLEGVVANSSIWFSINDNLDNIKKLAISRLIDNYDKDISMYRARISRLDDKINFLKEIIKE